MELVWYAAACLAVVCCSIAAMLRVLQAASRTVKHAASHAAVAAADSSVRLHMQPTSFNRRVLSRVPRLSNYSAGGCFANPHVSTLWGIVLRSAPTLQFAGSERVKLHDGGTLALDWVAPAHGAASTHDARPRVCIVFPGTRGSKESSYVRAFAHKAASGGFLVCICALRGCGVDELSTPQCFDGAKYTDVAAAVTHVRASLPRDAYLCAVGFSMGGGMLAHHLSVTPHAAGGLDAAVCVSSPTDYNHTLDHLHAHASGRFYSAVLTHSSKSALLQHHSSLRRVRGLSLARALCASTVREWHDAVTCVLQGVKDSRTFCEQASFRDELKNVRTPLLMLNAEDDPVCPHTSVDERAVAASPRLVIARPRTGGHTGFPDGDWPWARPSWDHVVAVEFLTAVCDVMEEDEGRRLPPTGLSTAKRRKSTG